MIGTSAILLHAADNVICLLRDHVAGEIPLVSIGDSNTCEGPALAADVPLGHKVAITDIPHATDVIKYGERIGQSSRDISVGEHVHLHNLEGFVHNVTAR